MSKTILVSKLHKMKILNFLFFVWSVHPKKCHKTQAREWKQIGKTDINIKIENREPYEADTKEINIVH